MVLPPVPSADDRSQDPAVRRQRGSSLGCWQRCHQRGCAPHAAELKNSQVDQLCGPAPLRPALPARQPPRNRPPAGRAAALRCLPSPPPAWPFRPSSGPPHSSLTTCAPPALAGVGSHHCGCWRGGRCVCVSAGLQRAAGAAAGAGPLTARPHRGGAAAAGGLPAAQAAGPGALLRWHRLAKGGQERGQQSGGGAGGREGVLTGWLAS